MEFVPNSNGLGLFEEEETNADVRRKKKKGQGAIIFFLYIHYKQLKKEDLINLQIINGNNLKTR